MWRQSANHSLSLRKRLHLESSKQNYYIISLRAIIKAIFTHSKATTCGGVCRLQDRGAVQGRSKSWWCGIAHRRGRREARLARSGIREHDAFLGHEMRGPAGTGRGSVSMAGVYTYTYAYAWWWCTYTYTNQGSKPLQETKFEKFVRGKSVLLNSKLQIREFHAEWMECGEVFGR